MLDANPLTSKNTQITDALNATLITFNGNEMMLQNDMGNTKVQDAKTGNILGLREGFIPVGVKEHGGIIYIASVNEDGEGEIGTIPSPVITWDDCRVDTQTTNDLSFYDGVSQMFKLTDSFLHVGDKFLPVLKDEFESIVKDTNFTIENDPESRSKNIISSLQQEGIYTCNIYAKNQNNFTNINRIIEKEYWLNNKQRKYWFVDPNTTFNIDLERNRDQKKRIFLNYPSIQHGQLFFNFQKNNIKSFNICANAKNNLNYPITYTHKNDLGITYYIGFYGFEFETDNSIIIDTIKNIRITNSDGENLEVYKDAGVVTSIPQIIDEIANSKIKIYYNKDINKYQLFDQNFKTNNINIQSKIIESTSRDNPLKDFMFYIKTTELNQNFYLSFDYYCSECDEFNDDSKIGTYTLTFNQYYADYFNFIGMDNFTFKAIEPSNQTTWNESNIEFDPFDITYEEQELAKDEVLTKTYNTLQAATNDTQTLNVSLAMYYDPNGSDYVNISENYLSNAEHIQRKIDDNDEATLYLNVIRDTKMRPPVLYNNGQIIFNCNSNKKILCYFRTHLKLKYNDIELNTLPKPYLEQPGRVVPMGGNNLVNWYNRNYSNKKDTYSALFNDVFRSQHDKLFTANKNQMLVAGTMFLNSIGVSGTPSTPGSMGGNQRYDLNDLNEYDTDYFQTNVNIKHKDHAPLNFTKSLIHVYARDTVTLLGLTHTDLINSVAFDHVRWPLIAAKLTYTAKAGKYTPENTIIPQYDMHIGSDKAGFYLGTDENDNSVWIPNKCNLILSNLIDLSKVSSSKLSDDIRKQSLKDVKKYDVNKDYEFYNQELSEGLYYFHVSPVLNNYNSRNDNKSPIVKLTIDNKSYDFYIIINHKLTSTMQNQPSINENIKKLQSANYNNDLQSIISTPSLPGNSVYISTVDINKSTCIFYLPSNKTCKITANEDMSFWSIGLYKVDIDENKYESNSSLYKNISEIIQNIATTVDQDTWYKYAVPQISYIYREAYGKCKAFDVEYNMFAKSPNKSLNYDEIVYSLEHGPKEGYQITPSFLDTKFKGIYLYNNSNIIDQNQFKNSFPINGMVPVFDNFTFRTTSQLKKIE